LIKRITEQDPDPQHRFFPPKTGAAKDILSAGWVGGGRREEPQRLLRSGSGKPERRAGNPRSQPRFQVGLKACISDPDPHRFFLGRQFRMREPQYVALFKKTVFKPRILFKRADCVWKGFVQLYDQKLHITNLVFSFP
jgi:hypothetical protein